MVRRALVTARDNPPHPTWQWIFSALITIFSAIVGFLAWQLHETSQNDALLSREVGEAVVIMRSHLLNHPDTVINEELGDHEDRIRDLERGR